MQPLTEPRGDNLFHNLITLDNVLQDAQNRRSLRRRERQLCTDLSQHLEPFISKIRFYMRLRHTIDRSGSRQGPVEAVRAEPIRPPEPVGHEQRVPFRQYNNMVSNMMQNIMGGMLNVAPADRRAVIYLSDQKQQAATLENIIFRPNDELDIDEKQCGICREEFTDGENIVKTTCCGTKLMHVNCAIHCLRRSDMCPFCRAARIRYG